MILFDTHAHLDDERFDEDRDAVVQRMADAGVKYCMCIGADQRSSMRAVEIAGSRAGFYAAVGIHPESAESFTSADEIWMRGMVSEHPDIIKAIGEIGLDYHYDGPPHDIQMKAFDAQYNLAASLNLPVILHIRDAHDDMTAYLKANHTRRPPDVILHCYSGNLQQAYTYIDMGCVISFAGNVTFRNARDLRDAASHIPLDSMLVETDCPYMAPEPRRGKRNEPAYVSHTASRIAELRCIDPEELARAATQNALRVFGIHE